MPHGAAAHRPRRLDRPGARRRARVRGARPRCRHPRGHDHRRLREDGRGDRKKRADLAGVRRRGGRGCGLQEPAPGRRLSGRCGHGRADEVDPRVRPRAPRGQTEDRAVFAAPGRGDGHDGRRRQRRAGPQPGQHRRRYGDPGHGGGQGRFGHDPHRRQLLLDRRCRREGPRHLRRHPEVRGLYHVGPHCGGASDICVHRRRRPCDAHAAADPVPHLGHRLAAVDCAGHGAR
mmetsp:Transcript_81086/g.247781  ORF Transcript_81086/g.247781 Transcript_81086/m.247781 type:complete len:232 (+) Transcript_81086:1867-2562(+)